MAKEDWTEQPKLGERFNEALDYAARLHRKQLRKGTDIPYVSHLLAVASIVLEHGGAEDEAIGALLHDAAEDCGPEEMERIRTRFGDAVAVIVGGCTDTLETPKPAWRPRKGAYIAGIPHKSPATILVSTADKLHNARAILADYRTHGGELWNRFSAGDHQEIMWYYRALADAFDRERERVTPVFPDFGALRRELRAVVDELTRAVGAERPAGG